MNRRELAVVAIGLALVGLGGAIGQLISSCHTRPAYRDTLVIVRNDCDVTGDVYRYLECVGVEAEPDPEWLAESEAPR